jgi:hypothetical protein
LRPEKITFRGARSSHSKIHTSSRLNTNSAQEPGRCSLRDAIIVSKKDRGTASRGFSWGRRVISDCSSLCRNKRELTHPGVTAAPKVSPKSWSISVQLMIVWFWVFFVIQSIRYCSLSTSSAGCSARPFGIVSPPPKRGEHVWTGRRKHEQWPLPPIVCIAYWVRMCGGSRSDAPEIAHWQNCCPAPARTRLFRRDIFEQRAAG